MKRITVFALIFVLGFAPVLSAQEEDGYDYVPFLSTFDEMSDIFTDVEMIAPDASPEEIAAYTWDMKQKLLARALYLTFRRGGLYRTLNIKEYYEHMEELIPWTERQALELMELLVGPRPK